MRLRAATTNAGKLAEFARAARELGFDGVEILPLEGMKTIEACVEDGLTFEENAVKKAIYYSRFCQEPLFADDSGLEVEALEGEPGVYSARYSDEGTDEGNNRKLLERMKGVERRGARFVCVVAVARNGVLSGTYRGEVEGEIALEARGAGGFGYDPLFWYEPFGCTFGEVDAARKMGVSHRGMAIRKMLTDEGKLTQAPPSRC